MKIVISYASLVILASAVYYAVAADQKCVSKRAEFKPLTITPSFVPITGNIPITIEGPSITNDVKIEIRFHDRTVQTVTATISGGKATCLVPYLYTNGRIQVDMIITRPNTTGGDTFYGFIYTEKNRNELKFELVSKTQIKVSWDKTKFDTSTTLKLVLLELVGGVFTPRGVIKSNIPNNGQFTGDLDSTGVTIIQKLRNVYITQLETTTTQSSTGTSGGSTTTTTTTTTTNKNNPLVSSYLNTLITKTQAEIDQMCLDWYIQDTGVPKDVLCCPPTAEKAKADEFFEQVDDLKPYNPDADIGYRQRNPSKSGGGQRCVYKGGNLLVGPPSGGTQRKVSPNGPRGEVDHFLADIAPWFLCCNTNKANCKLYYERRPSNDGKCYKGPGSGMVIGDPHFTTFDGFYYTFLGLGEFWVIKSLDGVFSMQGRFTQYLNTGATVCTVYVMQYRGCDGTGTIQLSLKKDYIEIMIDGQIVQIDSQSNQSKRTIAHKGANIALYSQKDIRISFSSGYAFKFTYDPNVINMIALLQPELKGTFTGLFGNYDGNQDNEFTYPNGKVIPKNSNAKDINDFGMSWKITCQESLFTYPSDKGYESFHDDSYVPNTTPVDVDKVPPKAKEVCGDNYECLFDFTVTGNLEMAVSTMTTVTTFIAITQTFSVSCPRVTVPRNGSLEVLNNAEGSTVKLTCNDSFKLKGSDSIKCVRNAQGGLAWDGKLGECSNSCANDNTWLQWLCENGFSTASAS